MDHDEKLDSPGAHAHKPILGEGPKPVPDKLSNPADEDEEECDIKDGHTPDFSCSTMETTQLEDLVLDEDRPGIGIPGYEGEEDGGA